MDLNYKQEITVGTMVLVGIALFIAGTCGSRGPRSAGNAWSGSSSPTSGRSRSAAT